MLSTSQLQKLQIALIGVSLVMGVRRGFSADVIFNEIMYHPTQPLDGPEPVAEEFIELSNRGAEAVNLNGWRILGGIDFVFSDVSLPAGGYLVAAADRFAFTAKYPEVGTVVGNWVGKLSDRWQTLELVDALGQTIDRISYASQGDWAVRRKGPVLAGTQGWEWFAEHDGFGKSLERIHPGAPTRSGQNWQSSSVEGGTPGAVNSVAKPEIPPVIEEVEHVPALPLPSDSVTIRARLIGSSTNAVEGLVHYRNASTETPPAFGQVPMFDDGLHGDGGPGDGVFGGTLPPQSSGTIIEFYVEARHSPALSRTWPAPVLGIGGVPGQNANALYQVTETDEITAQPIYRIIMTQAERLVLRNINPTSDAELNATFISLDDTGTKIRYRGGVRIRGAGSRFRTPVNYRFSFPNDIRWNGLSDINLNTQYTFLQLAAGRVALKAGLPAANLRAVQVRVNGENLASSDTPQFGSYVFIEPLDGDWAGKHFPLDGKGNLYRCSVGAHTANLSKLTSKAQAISRGYSKSSNTSEDDWSDLLGLTAVLNDTPDDQYSARVRDVVDVEQWMRYFAFMTIVTSLETSIATGDGDDYSLYRASADSHFFLLPHDLDTVFGLGDTSSRPDLGIFRMVPAIEGGNTQVLNRFMLHPEFVSIYYRELLRQLDTVFAPEVLDPLLDQALSSFVPADTIASMKNFQVARNAGVRGQIPLSFTATTSLPVSGGFPRTTASHVSVEGTADSTRTMAVEVNGVRARFSVWEGIWQATNVPVSPGLSRVLVRALGEGDSEVDRRLLDIWYDDGSTANVSGILNADTTWSAVDGPYRVGSTLTVPVGRSLTVLPGTTVYFAQGAGLIINGTLSATGTESARIRFSSAPTTPGTWLGVQLNNTMADNRIAFVDFENAEGGSHHLGASNSRVLIEHCTWNGGGTRSFIELVNSSAQIRNCVFPDLSGAEHIHGGPVPASGYVIIEGNQLGTTTGLNDIIDFTGARRPGPALQVRNNVFLAASDDVLDLDGTDAWVEGNLFMHVHKNNPNVGDTSSAISYGEDGGYGPNVIVVRNYFYDVDHVALCKEGGLLTLLNNTAVGINVAAVNFSEPERNTRPGKGALLDGNIFWNPPGWTGTNFQNRFPTNGTVSLTANRNIVLPGDALDTGIGNFIANPNFVNPVSNAITAATFTQALALRPGSPAIGKGPNRIDQGAGVSADASISGEPESVTSSMNAALTVGGPGISNYIYRLDGGAWSAERPVTIAISLTGLVNGSHQVEVLGRNGDGIGQPTNRPTSSLRWTVDSSLAGVRLNEILASNSRAAIVNGEFPDAVELFNRGNTFANLSGYGLSSDPDDPFKYRFPVGTTVGARGYLVVYADHGSGPSLYLDFALRQTGDSLYLFRPDGTLADSISFGLQIQDLSIGRLRNDEWGLTVPSLGSANIVQPVGALAGLRINEWLANAEFQSSDDFVELFNSDPAPVALGGSHLTDEPVGYPGRHTILPLSFISGGGLVFFHADANPMQGPNHLNFRLSAEQGSIGLFDPQLALIDCVIYGPQSQDRSEGRQPSGAEEFVYFSQPTPGSPNPAHGDNSTVTTQLTRLIPLESAWKYDDSGADLGEAWRQNAYPDDSWSVGSALFGVDTSAYPIPFSTPLRVVNGRFTFYFRTHFTWNGSTAGVRLVSTNLLDDGVVYYLNGFEAARRRMDSNPGFQTPATAGQPQEGQPEVFDLSADNLQPGDNVLAAELHQSAAGSVDVAFAMALTAVESFTNTTVSPVVLNEVLAANSSYPNGKGKTPDFVELYNASGTATDLGGLSLSDDPTQPRRWIIPNGITLEPGSYLRIQCDADTPASVTAEAELNTGFGLDDHGDRMLLYDRTSSGGALIDSVFFGFQAADFSIARQPDGYGAWTLGLPTPAGPNLTAALGTTTNLRINEWMANPASGDDWFEIYNSGAQPVAMGGLALTDELGNAAKSIVPPLSFLGASTNGFVKFIADNSPSKGATHVRFKLSESGEAIGLYRGAGGGVPIDAITFAKQVHGVSEGPLPDGSTNVVMFQETSSPGESNFLPLRDVIISEVLTHTDPPLEDAVELQNIGQQPVDVSGWFLSDSSATLRKYRIPNGTVIRPAGFLVLYEYQFNELPGNQNSFSFSSVNGDQAYLASADLAGNLLGYRSIATFGPAQNGVSFRRLETSVGVDYPAQVTRTFGRDDATTTNDFRLGTGKSNAPPRIGPLVINEIHYHPPDVGTNDNVLDEFIELRNVSGERVGLYHSTAQTNTWRLRGAVDFEFPPNVVLEGGDYVLLASFDPTADPSVAASFRSKYKVPSAVRIFGPFRGKLKNDGDSVELYKPDDPQLAPHPDAGFVPYVLVDGVHFSDSAPWPSLADTYRIGNGASLQRRVSTAYGNEPTNWLAGLPSAGSASGASLGTLPTLSTQPRGATATEGTIVTLSAVAMGTEPFSYQWRLGAQAVLGATNPVFVISPLSVAKAGDYTVLVSNPAGAVLSDIASVRIGGAPAVLTQPRDQYVASGATVTFSVGAGGALPLYYQWRRNGLEVPNAVASTFVLSNVQAANQGAYSVVITNTFGSVTSTLATLSLGIRPSVVNQPQSQTAFTGGSARFEVTASGTNPLHYQWQFNGIPISGADGPSLELKNLVGAQTGNYFVVVTNLYGAVTSAGANLTVIPLPIVTIEATDPVAQEGGTDTALFIVTRSFATNQPLVVQLAIGGSAQNGVDFVALPNSITIPANRTTATLSVVPLDDAVKEVEETVVVSVLVNSAYVLGLRTAATVALRDNDTGPIGDITNRMTLISITNTWRYEQTADLTGTSWSEPLFDDKLWPLGPAALFVEGSALPVAKRTPLRLGRMTYYFRTHFQVSDTNGLALTATNLVDDGAVFYLNGSEAFRVGIPDGIPDYNTLASRSVGNAQLEGPFQWPTTGLVVGDNVVAVEVHQIDEGSSDIVFAMSLVGEITAKGRPALVDPRWAANGDFQFSVLGQAGVTHEVEYSRDLVTWSAWVSVTVPGAGSALVTDNNARTEAPRFYRARVGP